MVRKGHYDGLIYIRSSVNDVDPVEEVGFLSGNAEKFAVYLHPLEDTLDGIVRTKAEKTKLKGEMLEAKVAEGIEDLRSKCNIQSMTTLGLRGRTFINMYIICDEMQNNSAPQFQKVLTRIGKGCKVVILGSNRQIDNKYVTKYTNGLAVLLNACTKPNEYIRVAAVTLHKVVRSSMAEFAEKLFSK
jgi:PhoH-like ATPase